MPADVTIIGAGPAGSTAAILLARGGWDVTLVEQSRFPRDKVCGECLSALGFDVLTRLGLAEFFREPGAVRLDSAIVHSASGRRIELQLPQPMWGLSRRAFDVLLLDAARAAGARVRHAVRCEYAGLGLRLRDLTTNRVETICPAQVILADGKASFAPDAPSATGEFGIKTHFANVNGPRDAIELFGVRGSYGGLAAIEDRRWNAAFSVPGGRLKDHRGDVDALFAQITSENEALAGRLAGARRVGPWLASPLPRYPLRRRWIAGVLPVGNAAAAIEPIGGEGMGLAMRSAELAARMLLGGRFDAASLRRQYARLWRTRSAACRGAAVVVSQPLTSAALVRSGVGRFAAGPVLKWIGKG